MNATPRMRMFAGPNGSGKSILKELLPREFLGEYVNPDEMLRSFQQNGMLRLRDFSVTTSVMEWRKFKAESRLLHAAYPPDEIDRVEISSDSIVLNEVEPNAYLASATADFVRQLLIRSRASFTFETVMSSRDKVELLDSAQSQQYRTYLYYIATVDPEINKLRVANRVLQGGHSVPEDKIVSRYYRSLDLLLAAIRNTDRAYIFDNSVDGPQSHSWIAEVTNGSEIELKIDIIPAWFQKSVLDKIGRK